MSPRPPAPTPETPSAAPRRLPALLWILAIAAAGLSVYANSLDGPFVFDDEPSIVANPNIRSLTPLSRALSGPPGSASAARPVAALSLALNYAAGGLRVFGYHLFNVAVHVLAALALFALVRLTLVTVRERAAADRALPPPLATAGAIALLWVVHPLCTDALNHVSYRNEALMALFYVLTLGLAARGFRARRPRGWLAIAVVACALGMGSKEPMVSAPLAVLLYDRTFAAGSFAAALRRRPLLYLGLAATWGVLAWSVSSGHRGVSVGGGWTGIGRVEYAIRQIPTVLLYLKLSLWPHPLVLDYGPYYPGGPGLATLWPQAALLLALVAGTLVLAVRRHAAGFAGLVALAVLAPSSSVILILGEPIAEHRAYLPSMAVVSVVVLAAWRGLHALEGAGTPTALTRSLAAVLLVGAAGALGWRTVERNRDYRSGLTIWADTARKQPDNHRAHMSLGTELVKSHAYPSAEEAYRRVLELQPDNAPGHYNLATVLLLTRREAAARTHFARVHELDPNHARVTYGRGVSYLLSGRTADGIAQLRGARLVDPGNEECALHLATLLATAPDARLRNGAEAVEIAEALGGGSSASDPRHLEVLAAAYAEVGRYEDAVRVARTGLELARRAGRRRLERRFEERAALYAEGRPLRLDPAALKASHRLVGGGARRE